VEGSLIDFDLNVIGLGEVHRIEKAEPTKHFKRAEVEVLIFRPISVNHPNANEISLNN
jgi:hypothetical protein